MTALAAIRASSIKEVTRERRPLAANAKVWQGALAACIVGGVGVTSSGFFKQGVSTDNAVVRGRFAETVDNTGGADGVSSADIHFTRERHLFLVNNDPGGGALVAADREGLCYVLDDQTVTKTVGLNVAGIVYDVTTEGVWIEMFGPAPTVPTVQRGTSTLVAGTKALTGLVLTANSIIQITMRDPGAGAIPAFAAFDVPVGTRTATGFTVNAIDNTKATIATAVCTFDYVVIG